MALVVASSERPIFLPAIEIKQEKEKRVDFNIKITTYITASLKDIKFHAVHSDLTKISFKDKPIIMNKWRHQILRR